jgi:hypothetical protein
VSGRGDRMGEVEEERLPFRHPSAFLWLSIRVLRPIWEPRTFLGHSDAFHGDPVHVIGAV